MSTLKCNIKAFSPGENVCILFIKQEHQAVVLQERSIQGLCSHLVMTVNITVNTADTEAE